MVTTQQPCDTNLLLRYHYLGATAQNLHHNLKEGGNYIVING